MRCDEGPDVRLAAEKILSDTTCLYWASLSSRQPRGSVNNFTLLGSLGKCAPRLLLYLQV